MDARNYENIRDHVCRLFAERWSDHDRRILHRTLLLMLQGRSVSAELLAEKYDESLASVSAAFDTSRYDLNEAGQVVDVFGVSIDGNRPFRVTTADTTLHICCALVALMVCQLSADEKTMRSTDPVSGQEIRVAVSATAYEISPRDAVAVQVAPPVEKFIADPWNSFCKYVRLYESVDTAAAATSKDVSAVTLPVDELRKIAATLSTEMWGSDHAVLDRMIAPPRCA